MGDRGIAISVALALAVCWGVTSLDLGGGNATQYEKDCGAVFLEAANRIDRGEITNDKAWHDFLEAGRMEAGKRNFRWIDERMNEAVSGDKWDARKVSEASREIGKKLGG